MFCDKHLTALNRVYDLFCDEESRNIFASVIKTYITGDEGHLCHSSYKQYEHPRVMAQAGDIIIDGGAYTGDTLALFHNQVTPQLVLCLEPTKSIFQNLLEAGKRFPQTSICKPLGLWSEPCVINFSENGRSAAGNRIVEHGSQQIQCTNIDSLVRQHGLAAVDMIKLDVEGSEQEALTGARQTILSYKPRLQVSVYHHIEDIFAIPLMIQTMRPDYQFYMGHHAPDVHETVLYDV